jgi:hypothetical protein
MVALKSGIADRVFDGFVAALIGSTINLPATDAATGHEASEAGCVVIAAVILIDLRRAAELGGEHDERLLQHAARFQILQQGAQGGVEFIAELRHAGEVGVVGVPTAEGNLGEAHAMLDETAGEQAALAEAVVAIFVAQFASGFGGEVEGFQFLALHHLERIVIHVGVGADVFDVVGFWANWRSSCLAVLRRL